MAMPSQKKGITTGQKALIHTAKRDLGLDDATYREMLRNIAGVASSKDLTPRQFEAVIAHLEARGFDHKSTGYWANKKKWDVLGRRPGMATAAQLARIEAEWEQLRFYWGPKGFPTARAAMKAFVKKITNVDDLRFLNGEKAVQVLTVIEKIKTRQAEPKIQEG